MDCSTEMKMQAIDKMIEMRNQLITMQDNLGMYNSVDNETPILIYQTDDFFEIANMVNGKVKSGDVMDSGRIEITFNYKDTEFNTFILPVEYQLHEHEIDRGENNE